MARHATEEQRPADARAAGRRPAARGRAGRARRLRWWLGGLAGGLVLALAGAAGYSGLLIYQFQHAIYHPLPTAEPAEAPAAIPGPASVIPATAAPGTPTPREPGPIHAFVLPAGATPSPRPATPSPLPATPTAELAPGRTNILVLGTDQRPGETASRSDTLIILSLDARWKTLGLLSVPRDLQVPIPGYGQQKINAAYFFGQYDHLPGGGPALAMTTVSQYFGIDIPYYASINFTGFEQVIDLIGGIDVYVPAPIDDPLYPGPNNSYMHVYFAAGCQHLDGARALEYARTRHADSDFGRIRRQQQVIQAVRARVLQLDMVPHFPALLGQLGDSIATNVPPDQQLGLAQLAAAIPGSDIYTAQIDNTLVSAISSTGDLALNWPRATPLLDWFFGRGAFADRKPGTRATPPSGTATPAGPPAPAGQCP